VQEAPRPPVPPRDAASVILVRDGAQEVEVLLLQRHPGSRFSPGAFAFPGGRIEAEDAAPGIERRCRGLTRLEAARRLRDVAPPDRALGFWVASLREAFEEAGLLHAYGRDGHPVDTATLAEARQHRAACRQDSAAFGRLLADLDLVLATDRVGYWAHWITPEERPVRYDTRFFVAAALSEQAPEPDGLEVVGWCWIGPDAALARHAAGELVLPFPTQRILAALAGHASAETVVAAARDRVVHPVRPRVVRDGTRERVLLPEDPGWF
jgi:8-oxo-dGTP pyrophosphatase MutT (NUDIX family)